jgi:hypothetical protein
MRTTFPLVLVLAMAITATFFVGSGFNDVVDGSQSIDPVQEEVDQRAAESAAGSGNFSADRGGTDEGSIVGLVVGGAQDIVQFTSLVALLPITLNQLGFPGWFAFTIGGVLQIVVSIGILQFVTGRQFR